MTKHKGFDAAMEWVFATMGGGGGPHPRIYHDHVWCGLGGDDPVYTGNKEECEAAISNPPRAQGEVAFWFKVNCEL